MLRTFNRHQIKKVWYPSPRFYMVSVDCAEELGKAIIAAARGETYTASRDAKLRVFQAQFCEPCAKSSFGSSIATVTSIRDRPSRRPQVRCSILGRLVRFTPRPA